MIFHVSESPRRKCRPRQLASSRGLFPRNIAIIRILLHSRIVRFLVVGFDLSSLPNLERLPYLVSIDGGHPYV